jgi:hypothetical protein
MNLPVDEVFHAVVDVDRWDRWLVRIPSRLTSQGPVAVGSTAMVPLENFWGTPVGMVAALAGLSRTHPYGRAYGEMEVIEHSRNRALTLESRNSPIRLRVSLSVSAAGAGTDLSYEETFHGLSPLLSAVAILASPLMLPALALVQLGRPVFGWALRRRLRRIENLASSVQ